MITLPNDLHTGASEFLHVSLQSDPSQPTLHEAQTSSVCKVSEERIRRGDDAAKMLCHLMEITREVTAAENRVEAVAALTVQLASLFPDANIRAGFGANKLDRLYDRRLGWLGIDSGPAAAAAQQWSSFAEQETTVLDVDTALILCMKHPESAQRCAIWIDTANAGETVTQWLKIILPTINATLWSRPKRLMPRALRQIGGLTVKLIAAILLMLLLLSFWPTDYRVACSARVEPIQQRVISAPFAATLLEAHVEPGATVKVGDVLVTLDGRPLRIERESIAAEIQAASKSHDTALASGRVADAQQAKLKERQLTRTQELITDRLGRLQVTSPIDGVVISGELTQHVGAPLELGQSLLEIAPLQTMTVEVEIPAHEIGFVKQHATTRLRFAAIGGRSQYYTLNELYPSAEVRDDNSVFIGRIEVENSDGQLRPGMIGDATTYGPSRPWVWPWIRGGFERMLWWIGY